MFSLLTLVLSCKGTQEAHINWTTCTDDATVYTGETGSEFGFRMLTKNDALYITAPSNCDTPLYTLESSGIVPVSWESTECARWGQELTHLAQPVLYGPLSERQWNTDIEIGSTNIKRLQTLPDGRLVQLGPDFVKIGGIHHPLPGISMDMARYDDVIAVLMRGIPTQIWTIDATFTFDQSTALFNRIHPFVQTLSGNHQWVLGGGSQLVYTDGEAMYTVPLPEWSRLQQDLRHHPAISIGYASTLTDINDDGILDWIVGAPTAGSGNSSTFPEQAGWVGWFEHRNREWILVQEWTGTETFEHLGWSVAIYETKGKRSVFAGSPGTSRVSEIVCLEPQEE